MPISDFQPDGIAKVLDDISRSFRESWSKQDGPVPRKLYHYTTAHGLIGIVSGNRFHATDIKYTNDAREWNYGWQIIGEIIGPIIHAVDIPGKQLLNRVLSTVDPPYCVVCFCREDDLLSQWRGYGAMGGGYAIGFDTADWSNVLPPFTYLRAVCYDEARARTFLSQLISQTVSAMMNDCPNDLPSDDPYSRFLSDELSSYVCYLKNAAFKEEQEWRIAHRPRDQRDLLVRSSGNHLIPYCSLDVCPTEGSFAKKLPISSVTSGPSLHPDLARNAIDQLFCSSQVSPSPQVRSSRIPFRHA